jgi:oxaloacetate decarboxylase gamma subunit
MENLTESLILMGVGMTTVFAVLGLVILAGNLLIHIVNKYFPEKEKPKGASVPSDSVNPSIAAAIENAVKTITNGKGKVEKIEKK